MNERFQVRWANGFWRLFDTFNYTTVDLAYTEKEALGACAEANAQWLIQTAKR